MRLKSLNLALPFALLLNFSINAQAADFSYTGNFINDNDVQTFNFSVGVPSAVTLRTWSYAGGVNAAGNTIDRGGFDPILALFDASSGFKINENDDGDSLVTDDTDGNPYDTFLTSALSPGNYTVSIQQFNNFATGPLLSDGFAYDGVANADFRNGFNGRDSHWAFDIINVNNAVINTSPVPEPETYAMLLSGLGLIGFVARRRKVV